MQASPSTHFVSFAQAILYRGAGLDVVWPEFLAVAAIGGLFFGLAIMRFSRRAGHVNRRGLGPTMSYGGAVPPSSGQKAVDWEPSFCQNLAVSAPIRSNRSLSSADNRKPQKPILSLSYFSQPI